ncbi:hypothetical protein E6P78_28330 [Streptomyces sp. A0958]|uniref:hypothetical protein n=1 Tax=Streptomyces sp. A0958 TaxID=2563101 RepID=UPI00109E5907|nr:hypothetical protein [Streptomyces sp. A0958]THA59956.1 hypothetical protein E6P78_28330 [Streptomyces sp. A0958]
MSETAADGVFPGRYPLASAQLNFLFDEIEYPGNSWVAIRESVHLPGRLTERQARNLFAHICRYSEAVHSRIVQAPDGVFRQEITELDHFFAHSFDYAVAARPQDVLTRCPQRLDAFTGSAFFLVADAPGGAVVYYAVHHSFFDGVASGLLGALILRAAADPEILDGSRPDGVDGADGTGGEPAQPRQVRAFETDARGVRSTRRWLGFHETPRALVWPGAPAEAAPVDRPAGGLDTEYRVTFALGGGLARALPRTAAELGVSAPSLVNSLVCGYVGELFGLREVTLKTICSNRFRPVLRPALACLAGEVWVARGTEHSGRPEWHRRFHGELLAAYRSGMYDWDAVRRSANFPGPYRSGQSVSTNVAYAKGERPGPPAGDVPVFTAEEPLRVPRVLGHELAVHAVIGSPDVHILIKAAAHRMDEAATLRFARGLFAHFTRSLSALRAVP